MRAEISHMSEWSLDQVTKSAMPRGIINIDPSLLEDIKQARAQWECRCHLCERAEGCGIIALPIRQAEKKLVDFILEVYSCMR